MFIFASWNVFSFSNFYSGNHPSPQIRCLIVDILATYVCLVAPDHDLFRWMRGFSSQQRFHLLAIHCAPTRTTVHTRSYCLPLLCNMLFSNLLWLGPAFTNHEFQQQGGGSPLFPFPPTPKENRSFIIRVGRCRLSPHRSSASTPSFRISSLFLFRRGR